MWYAHYQGCIEGGGEGGNLPPLEFGRFLYAAIILMTLSLLHFLIAQFAPPDPKSWMQPALTIIIIPCLFNCVYALFSCEFDVVQLEVGSIKLTMTLIFTAGIPPLASVFLSATIMIFQ